MRFLLALAFLCYTAARLAKQPLFNMEDTAAIYAKYLNYYNKSHERNIDLLRHYEDFKLELKKLNRINEESEVEVYNLDGLSDGLVGLLPSPTLYDTKKLFNDAILNNFNILFKK